MLNIPMLSFISAILLCSLASYHDFKKREVPDKISVGMIFLGLFLVLLYYYQFKDIIFLKEALLTAGIFFVIGMFLFLTGQWGGADAKILVGYGLLLSFYPQISIKNFEAFWPIWVTLFMNLMIGALIYTVLYVIFLSVKHREVFRFLKKEINRNQHEFIFIICLSIFLILFIFSLSLHYHVSLYLFSTPIIFTCLMTPLYAFLKLAKIIEKKYLIKTIKITDLQEYDLPAENIVEIDGKIKRYPPHILPKEGEIIASVKMRLGLKKKDIEKLKKLVEEGKLDNKIKIKWGMPFVPSFLFAMVLTLIFGDVFTFLMSL